MKNEANGLAAKIAADLFTDGFGTRCDRLAMVTDEEKRCAWMAGWSEKAATDRIAVLLAPTLDALAAAQALVGRYECSVLRLEGERDRFEAALRTARALAEKILAIRWGWDGDCGADAIAKQIIDSVDAALSKP